MNKLLATVGLKSEHPANRVSWRPADKMQELVLEKLIQKKPKLSGGVERVERRNKGCSIGMLPKEAWGGAGDWG